VSKFEAERDAGSRLYPLSIEAFTGICAIGRGRAQIAAALRVGQCGLAPNTFGDSAADIRAYVGRVAAVEQAMLPERLAAWDCRNHRLAWIALHEDGFDVAVTAAALRFGRTRIGVFVGSSTSGMLDTEDMFRNGQEDRLESSRFERRHSMGSVGDFVALALGLEGPRHCVSTACSSSAKVFAVAARYIAAGLCDAAVVGGVDSLCYTTLYGFASLELLSSQPARPFARDRSGISIGEGAAFALLVPDGAGTTELLGAGESSDGFHMSTPHPQGLGAERAISQALDSAQLQPRDIDYINLHGTGTPANDHVEALTVSRVFGSAMPCSSTKGATGHCLGAAGAVEALICDLALERQCVPANVGTTVAGVEPRIGLATVAFHTPLRRVLSNSFGFGGSNCALIFGAREALSQR
jgi:3-oxoacyl-[acyl-carrier-protein] synthase-1